MQEGESARLAKELETTAIELGKISPRVGGQFLVFVRHVYEDGVLTTKIKRLIALAVGVVSDCEWCIARYVEKAIEAGATKDEIIEACFVAIEMGGGPALASTSVAMKALEEFGA